MKRGKNLRSFVLVLALIFAIIQLFINRDAIVAGIIHSSRRHSGCGTADLDSFPCWDTGRSVFPDGASASSACAADAGVSCGQPWSYGPNGWYSYYFCSDPSQGCDEHCYDFHYAYFHYQGVSQMPGTSTGDLGSPRQCAFSGEAESSNLEIPGPLGSNEVPGNSSINLKSGNVYHSQQVGPLAFSYNSLDSYSGPPVGSDGHTTLTSRSA